MDMDAVEEAFICGDWPRVLQQSREKLLEYVALTTDASDATMTQTEEALVSMYLQSVFEMSAHDELETAAMITQSLSPLPFHISLQWIKFLIAMDHRSDALESLNALLQRCSMEREIAASTQTSDDWTVRYAEATEVLVFHVLLPSESSRVVRSYIANDRVLDDATKQRLLHAVDSKEAKASPIPPAATPTTTATPSSAHSSLSPSPQQRRDGDVNGAKATPTGATDPAADLASLGGTALAVAAVALGVYHFRDRLRDTVAEIGPAVSKGLADAKYALFES